MKYHILFIACAAFTIASCKSNTGPVSSVPWIVPATGGYYALQSNDSPYVWIDTMWITGQGAAHGKTNTITLDSGIFIAYEANGDISTWAPGEDSGWNRYPTGGGVTVDSEVDLKSGGSKYVARMTRTNIGSTTISLAGQNFSAIKVRQISLAFNYDPQGMLEDTGSTLEDFWFIPALGFYGKEVKSGIDGKFWSSSEMVGYKVN